MNNSETNFSFEDNIFDIIRYYAMFQVMIIHMVEHFKLQLTGILAIIFNFPGVVILFSLSGYLTAASLDRSSRDEKNNKKNFLRKRFLRIFPEYWLCVLINTIVIFMLYQIRPNFKEALVYIITQFGCLNFYTGDWLRGYGVGAPNGSLWTILVELEFYIIILFAWRWLKHKGIIAWSFILIILVGVNYLSAIIGNDTFIINKLINCSVIPYLYMFMIGAFIYRFRKKIFNYDRRWLIVINLILLCAYIFGGNYIIGNYIFLIKGISLAVLTINFGYLFNKKIRIKIDVTYGTYLYHMVVVNAIIALGVKINFTIMGVGLVISLILGLMSWKFNKALQDKIKKAGRQ